MWAAYPFTLYALSSNSNDSLVALLIVLALLVISSAPARGVAIALAGMAKFAPFALGPLFMRGADPVLAAQALAARVRVRVRRDRRRGDAARCCWTATSRVLARLVVSQIDRTSPFSIWGLWGGLGLEHAVQG